MPIFVYECEKGHEHDYLVARGGSPYKCGEPDCNSRKLTRVRTPQQFSAGSSGSTSGDDERPYCPVCDAIAQTANVVATLATLAGQPPRSRKRTEGLN